MNDRRSLREELGLPRSPRYVDGPPPREPNIDEVRAYHANELSPGKNGEVRDLIMMFEGWRELSRQVLEERAKAYRETDHAPIPSAADFQGSARKVRRRRLVVGAFVTAIVASIVITILSFSFPATTTEILDGDRRIVRSQDGWKGLDAYPNRWRPSLERVLAELEYEVDAEVDRLTQELREQGVLSQVDPYKAFRSPVNTVIDVDKPVLKWRQPSAGAFAFDVFVFDSEGNKVDGGRVEGTSWQVSQPLQRMKTYSWSLLAHSPSSDPRPAPPDGIPKPKFVILDARTEAEIQQRLEDVGDSHLLRSIVFARAGLLERAEMELSHLQKANSDSADLLQLLKSLQRQRIGAR